MEGQTTVASIGIGVALLEPLRISGYSIQNRQAWVRKDGENIIWIPLEYRTSTYATWGSTIALGDSSGRVTFLRLA